MWTTKLLNNSNSRIEETEETTREMKLFVFVFVKVGGGMVEETGIQIRLWLSKYTRRNFVLHGRRNIS